MTRGVEDKNICFHCRKDKKKCVKKTEEDRTCERCQHYKYECVPADSYGGTVPQPAFKKQPRCTQCRKDHKVCLPYERLPGETCRRCGEKGLPCVAATTSTARSSRPETPTTRTIYPDFSNTFSSSSSATSDSPYYQPRGFQEHGLQRRASLHTYSPHPHQNHYHHHHSSSSSSGPGTPMTPTYYSATGEHPLGPRRDSTRAYRPLAPAPHQPPPLPIGSFGSSSPHSQYGGQSMYSPSPLSPSTTYASSMTLQTPISPAPSYMDLDLASPPTSPHSSRGGFRNLGDLSLNRGNTSDRISEIMSINNLVDVPMDMERRPSSN